MQITTPEFNGEDILIDPQKNVQELVEQKLMMDKLRECISLLTDEEQELLRALFVVGLTEREYAQDQGVFHNAIHKRKERILKKLKKYLEI